MVGWSRISLPDGFVKPDPDLWKLDHVGVSFWKVQPPPFHHDYQDLTWGGGVQGNGCGLLVQTPPFLYRKVNDKTIQPVNDPKRKQLQ